MQLQGPVLHFVRIVEEVDSADDLAAAMCAIHISFSN